MADNVLKIDLTNFKDRVGTRIPAGTYRVVVDDLEQDTAKSGNTMINTWLRVVGGERDGAVIIDRLVLSEKSLFRVVGFMQAIGEKTPRKQLSINLDRWLGRALDVEVADGEPYNGRIKSEVRAYLKPSKSKDSSSEVSEDLPTSDAPSEELPSGVENEPVETGMTGNEQSATDEASDEIDVDEIDLG